MKATLRHGFRRLLFFSFASNNGAKFGLSSQLKGQSYWGGEVSQCDEDQYGLSSAIRFRKLGLLYNFEAALLDMRKCISEFFLNKLFFFFLRFKCPFSID